MTAEQKRALFENADKAGQPWGPAGVAELERILAWAESVEQDRKLLDEVLAGRLSLRIGEKGVRHFVQIGDRPADEITRHFDREYAAGR